MRVFSTVKLSWENERDRERHLRIVKHLLFLDRNRDVARTPSHAVTRLLLICAGLCSHPVEQASILNNIVWNTCSIWIETRKPTKARTSYASRYACFFDACPVMCSCQRWRCREGGKGQDHVQTIMYADHRSKILWKRRHLNPSLYMVVCP